MDNIKYLREYPEYWILDLGGRTVTSLFLDFSFGIDLYEKDKTLHIRIANVFTFTTSNKTFNIIEDKEYVIDPSVITNISPALIVFQKDMDKVIIYKSGDLMIHFKDGCQINTKASFEFEAWSIAGEDGLKFFSLPGNGGLEIYLPNQ